MMMQNFFQIDEIGVNNIYDLGDDYLGIDYEYAVLNKLAFSLFEYETCDSHFISLETKDTQERIMDIKRYNQDHILILTNRQLIDYSISLSKIVFNMTLENFEDNYFHIWINK